MPARLHVCADRRELATVAASHLADALRAACDARGRCSAALAGGSTPAPIYARLAQSSKTPPWERVALYLGDERCVGPDDAESNARLVREHLLAHLSGAQPTFHPIDGAERDPDAAAQRYEAELPDPLDVLVLGIGADGHTASLFPGSPALDETSRRVVPSLAPAPPARRITVTPPVVRAAREVFVLAAGADKAGALRAALEGPLEPARVPAQLARDGTWIVNRAAAGQLEETPA